MTVDPVYLSSGQIIRLTPRLTALSDEITAGAEDESKRAQALFYWVRDRIAYNPYSPFYEPRHYYPETTLDRGEGYCVQKSALLVALARSAGLPARMGFADIINHRFSEKLLEFMGSNLFTHHAFAEVFLNGRFVRLTPSFERPLADRLDIHPVEFDGDSDAMLHKLDKEGRLNIEYVRHHGSFADIPLDRILAGWEREYGTERVEKWKTMLTWPPTSHESPLGA
jgi:transglutaminase-like putative cysteine protease